MEITLAAPPPVEPGIKVTVSEAGRAAAARRAAAMGPLRNSIRQGGGNETGFLGEAAFCEAVGPAARLVDRYSHDIELAEVRVEVKTKECTSPPKRHYECSVARFNDRQACSIYVFARRLRGTAEVWLLGWALAREIKGSWTAHRKGDVDPANGFVFKADCWNAPISALRPVSELTALSYAGPPVSIY